MNYGLQSFDRQTGLVFDKRQTNIAKGVAVLLLLWHHLFYDDPEKYGTFISLFTFDGTPGVPIECLIARFCKVCVAVFLLLSGFGMLKNWESYRKRVFSSGQNRLSVKYQLVFVKNHLLKLMFGYWFIYVIFVPMGIFFGRPFWEIYEHNVLYGIIDVLGLANLFGTPTMNATWWFMSVIILFYILFLVLMKISEWSSEVLICLSIGLMLIPHLSSVPYIG